MNFVGVIMKVVINTCYGGFGLSHEAVLLYAKYKNIKLFDEVTIGSRSIYYIKDKNNRKNDNDGFFNCDPERDDPVLIRVVEELGDKANGMCASLAIIEIPDGISWEVEEYDGQEHISESHRTWG